MFSEFVTFCIAFGLGAISNRLFRSLIISKPARVAVLLFALSIGFIAGWHF